MCSCYILHARSFFFSLCSVTRGTDVVKAIENVKTDAKHDKPIDDIKIISIDIR